MFRGGVPVNFSRRCAACIPLFSAAKISRTDGLNYESRGFRKVPIYYRTAIVCNYLSFSFKLLITWFSRCVAVLSDKRIPYE